MKRSFKHPDTDTFKFFNANSHNRFGADCSVRAVCTALNQTWEDTVMQMTSTGMAKGFLIDDDWTIQKYLENNGWYKRPQPKKGDNTKFTGEEFCRFLTDNGVTDESIIANIGTHHIVCIKRIDGVFKVMDIWNSTDGAIGNYYTKSDSTMHRLHFESK